MERKGRPNEPDTRMGGMPEWDGERMPAATCLHNHGPDTRKGWDARMGRIPEKGWMPEWAGYPKRVGCPNGPDARALSSHPEAGGRGRHVPRST